MFSFKKSAVVALVLASAAIVSNAAIVPGSGLGAYGEQTIALQDGSTLHIYKDGKMAVENVYGRAVMIKVGQPLKTLGGKTIVMSSDEVARLSLENFQQNAH